MALDRRVYFSNKTSRPMKGNSTATPGEFASAQERRVMKKVAQPEHAYTGCVPYTSTDDEPDILPTKKNPPILGYQGHLRHDEDRIGMTFTQGLSIGSRAAEPCFAQENRHPKPARVVKAVGMPPRSGYGQFDHASGYGNLAAPPVPDGNKDMSPRSGYGAFDNASGYGAFAAPPARGGLSPRSGYREFENASGDGAFAAPPPHGGMSRRSGYGAFDNASGYGAFAAPPADVGMSARSGYGEFDNASGYGAFAAAPANKGEAMSARSGYGAIDNASGYGAFGGISSRSGYGVFENASGYGEFAAPPPGMSPRSGYGEFEKASGYGAFAAPPVNGRMSPRSAYGKFDDASGYGNFASPSEKMTRNSDLDQRLARGKHVNYRHGDSVHPPSNQIQELRKKRNTRQSTPFDRLLHAKYQQAIHRVGGEQAALRLWVVAAQTVWQRHTMRTELLQAVKRSFEKHEHANHGFMTKAQLKEVLRDLSCVFTDDQITALFGMYDMQCVGTVAISDLLLALTSNL